MRQFQEGDEVVFAPGRRLPDATILLGKIVYAPAPRQSGYGIRWQGVRSVETVQKRNLLSFTEALQKFPSRFPDSGKIVSRP
jgi:hypothetical protein